MANDDVDTGPIVYEYGLSAPLDWTPECDEQLRAQTVFWNVLVEIEHKHRAEIRAATADDPDVTRAASEYAAVQGQLMELIEARKDAWKQARRRVKLPELDEQIATMKSAARAASAVLSEAQKTARHKIKPRLDEINRRRFEEAKRARQQANKAGLWWGNANAVFADYERGRSAAMRNKTELKFHRWDGTGRLTNQIQGGMSLEKLFAGKHSQVQLERRSDDDAKPILSVTAFTMPERRQVRFPLHLHRDMPMDADIKEVVVHKRRLGNRNEWRATFLLRTARSKERIRGTIAAVNFGWRKVPDGIRVATILLAGKAQRPQFVILPERMIDDFLQLDEIQRRRAEGHARVVAALRPISFEGAPNELATVAQWWRSIPQPINRHTARLALTWRSFPEFQPAGLAVIEEWFAGETRWRDRAERRRVGHAERSSWWPGDKPLWLRDVNMRHELIGERRELFRRSAIKVLQNVKTLIMNKTDLRQIAERSDDSEDNMPAAARRYRVIASPGEMRRWLMNAAQKLGVRIVEHEGLATWRCAECGHRLRPHDKARLIHQCPMCNHIHEQDIDHCRNLLADYLSSTAAAAE
jgi:hypothetical protein